MRFNLCFEAIKHSISDFLFIGNMEYNIEILDNNVNTDCNFTGRGTERPLIHSIVTRTILQCQRFNFLEKFCGKEVVNEVNVDQVMKLRGNTR